MGVALKPGDVVGEHRIDSHLGGGGMGAVYLATSARGERVVIKTLQSHIESNAEMLARFEREARATASLSHPAIVRVLGFGTTPVPHLVMEHVEGRSLSQVLSQGPLPVDAVVRIGAQVLDALEVAHAAHVVHRDIKPANIMIVDDAYRVKLLDFGISRLVDEARRTKLTQTGQILGTPGYMAPEQARAGEVDGRADLYSLGVTLYHAIAGRLPFDGRGASLLRAVLQDEPHPLPRLRPDLDPRLVAWIHQAMAKSPDQRFASAAQMRRAWFGSQRRWGPWVAIAALLGVAAAVGVVAVLPSGESRAELSVERPVEVALAPEDVGVPHDSALPAVDSAPREDSGAPHRSERRAPSTEQSLRDHEDDVDAPVMEAADDESVAVRMTRPGIGEYRGPAFSNDSGRISAVFTPNDTSLIPVWHTMRGRLVPCFSRLPEQRVRYSLNFDARGRPSLTPARVEVGHIALDRCVRQRVQLVSFRLLAGRDFRLTLHWTPR